MAAIASTRLDIYQAPQQTAEMNPSHWSKIWNHNSPHIFVHAIQRPEKWTCSANEQPGRIRQKIFASWGPLFCRSSYIKFDLNQRSDCFLIYWSFQSNFTNTINNSPDRAYSAVTRSRDKLEKNQVENWRGEKNREEKKHYERQNLAYIWRPPVELPWWNWSHTLSLLNKGHHNISTRPCPLNFYNTSLDLSLICPLYFHLSC